MERFQRVHLKDVDWLSEERKSRLYDLNIGYVDAFYSNCRYYPEQIRQHLEITEQEYRDLLKRAEQLLPEEFIKNHDNPIRRHSRGLRME